MAVLHCAQNAASPTFCDPMHCCITSVPAAVPPRPRPGVVNSAGLCMLDLASKESDVVWEREDIHARAPGLCLRSAPSSKGGYGILLSSSNKTELRWVVLELYGFPWQAA